MKLSRLQLHLLVCGSGRVTISTAALVTACVHVSSVITTRYVQMRRPRGAVYNRDALRNKISDQLLVVELPMLGEIDPDLLAYDNPQTVCVC